MVTSFCIVGKKSVTTNHSLQLWENKNLSTLKGKLCVPMLENNISRRHFIDEETGSVRPSDLPNVIGSK